MFVTVVGGWTRVYNSACERLTSCPRRTLRWDGPGLLRWEQKSSVAIVITDSGLWWDRKFGFNPWPRCLPGRQRYLAFPSNRLPAKCVPNTRVLHNTSHTSTVALLDTSLHLI